MNIHLEPGFAIHLGQLQAFEDFIAHWRAYKSLVPVRSIDDAEAFNELDESSNEAAKVCREIRGLGS